MRKKFVSLAIMACLVFMLSSPAFAKSLFYASNPSEIATSEGTALNTGVALVTGQCTVQSIIVGGPHSAALDYILIYDAASATGTAKFDISIGTAGDTIPVPLQEVSFGTGVFADASSSGMHISVEYVQ